jgi:hypothetical protein
MLAMKEKDAAKERPDRTVAERQSENTSINTREEQDQRTERQEQKKMNTTNMNERARKSYHNDGPGGNYAGF